jgi:hypothetical protein
MNIMRDWVYEQEVEAPEGSDNEGSDNVDSKSKVKLHGRELLMRNMTLVLPPGMRQACKEEECTAAELDYAARNPREFDVFLEV